MGLSDALSTRLLSAREKVRQGAGLLFFTVFSPMRAADPIGPITLQHLTDRDVA
jgi:hypothetical protein